ncbi:uncharacterized protein LOC144363569 [Saccoglossus kowalevskii]
MHFQNSSRYLTGNMKRDRVVLVILTVVGLCFLLFVICVIVVVNKAHSRQTALDNEESVTYKTSQSDLIDKVEQATTKLFSKSPYDNHRVQSRRTYNQH